MSKYRHFKGGIYELLYIGEHSETQERMVVYRSAEGRVYIRPYDMFFSNVSVDGVEMARFTIIEKTEQ